MPLLAVTFVLLRAGKTAHNKQDAILANYLIGSLPEKQISLPLHSLLGIYRTIKDYHMPKMKTHSSAKKRFKRTGSGKIKRYQAKTSHMMRNKSKKAKLRLRDSTVVHEHNEDRVKRMLCM
jgi:large subunit ribosomal protein L35